MNENLGAVILCGGRSSRLNRDKATLPFGGQSMLERVLRTVAVVIPREQVVVVAAEDQLFPSQLTPFRIERDPTPFPGPLAALGAGFDALAQSSDYAFVCGCDSPLLMPTVIELLHAEAQGADAAVVQDDQRLYPLTAVYRTSLRQAIRDRLQEDDKSLHGFVRSINVKFLPVETVREVDPQLRSLVNVNSEADYQAALALAGLG